MHDWRRIEPYIEIGHEDILLLVGSAVLPWGSSTEEYDLVLITPTINESLLSQQSRERLSEQKCNDFNMAYIETPSGQLDIEAWLTKNVQSAIISLGSGIPSIQEIEQDFTYLAGIERKVGIDLFHNLFVGQAHPQTRERAESLIQTVNWERYFAWNRDYFLINVMDSIKGVRKSLREECWDEAYLKICWAFDNAADGLLFHVGKSIVRWKWRLRYLNELPQDFAETYRTVRLKGQPKSLVYFEEWLTLLERTGKYLESRPMIGGIPDGFVHGK